MAICSQRATSQGPTSCCLHFCVVVVTVGGTLPSRLPSTLSSSPRSRPSPFPLTFPPPAFAPPPPLAPFALSLAGLSESPGYLRLCSTRALRALACQTSRSRMPNHADDLRQRTVDALDLRVDMLQPNGSLSSSTMTSRLRPRPATSTPPSMRSPHRHPRSHHTYAIAETTSFLSRRSIDEICDRNRRHHHARPECCCLA